MDSLHTGRMATCALFSLNKKANMDNTVDNGFKCSQCPKRLASRYSLDRHIKLKHTTDDPPVKKQRLEDIGVKTDSGDSGEEHSDNGKKVIFRNNAGWVEVDGEEEEDIDNNIEV